MFRIPGKSGDVNNFEISFYPCQDGKDQQNKWQQILARIWRQRNSKSLLVGLKTVLAILEISVEKIQKAKKKSTMWPNFTTLCCLRKGLNILLHRYLLGSSLRPSIHNIEKIETM